MSNTKQLQQSLAMATKHLLSLLFLQFAFSLFVSGSTNAACLQDNFYKYACPDAELIVHKTVYNFIARDPTLAAPLLRLHFHDCFIRGCDGSVLLNSTKTNQAEKAAIPNLTLRGFDVIDAVKAELEKACPGVVSCADITALAARDAVLMIGGPSWNVPTGRRDGKVSISNEALTILPSPFANITTLKKSFADKGLNVKDLVVLSGAHTIGIGHCFIISNRLYNFTGKGDTDPSMDPIFAATLKKTCKPGIPPTSPTVAAMDPTFKTFDTKYYEIVAKRRGLFQSDAALLNDPVTRDYVKLQARPHGYNFAKDFAQSMVKMGKMGVLTGKQGNIRRNCAVLN